MTKRHAVVRVQPSTTISQLVYVVYLGSEGQPLFAVHAHRVLTKEPQPEPLPRTVIAALRGTATLFVSLSPTLPYPKFTRCAVGVLGAASATPAIRGNAHCTSPASRQIRNHSIKLLSSM